MHGGDQMAKTSVRYFDSSGEQNTDQVLEAVRERLAIGGIKHVIVASGTGATARRALVMLKDSGARITVVTEHCGASKEGECDMSPEMEKELLKAGARLVRGTHALSGVERAINKKIGGGSRVETVAEALRSLFGQGMKVCVEIAIMASDNGAIPVGDEEVIAVGGTSSGADTACVVRPANANAFFKLEVREILAMPRKRK